MAARGGKKKLFGELSLQVDPEDRIGIVGPNGSGKTSLLRLVAGERLPIDPLITQVSPIEETQRVFETIDANPTGMKYVIECGD